MAEATVNSSICGFVHKIQGRLERDIIVIDIDTPCEKIKEISHLEVPKTEILDIQDNYVIKQAKKADCGSNCLVPCGIIHICKIEAGLLSRSLCKKSGGISITFE